MTRRILLGDLPLIISGINKGRLDRVLTAQQYNFSKKQIDKAYNNWIQIFRIKESSLTFEEYLNKIQEIDINPDMIGNDNNQYHLSRYNDEGPYTYKSCRFITKIENLKEQRQNPNFVNINIRTLNKYGAQKVKEMHSLNGLRWAQNYWKNKNGSGS